MSVYKKKIVVTLLGLALSMAMSAHYYDVGQLFLSNIFLATFGAGIVLLVNSFFKYQEKEILSRFNCTSILRQIACNVLEFKPYNKCYAYRSLCSLEKVLKIDILNLHFHFL